MSDKSQRTEKPTPRRMEKARKEGQFPVSREFVSAVQFTVFVALLASYAPSWLDQAKAVLIHVTAYAFRPDFDLQAVLPLIFGIVAPMVRPFILLGGVLMASTLAVQLATTRLGFSANKLAPDFKRLNPLTRLKQIPQQNVPQLLQAMVLLPLFLFAVWVVVGDKAGAFLRLPLVPIEAGITYVAASIRELLWKAVGLFVLVGLIDFVRQRRKWMSEMMMSKQDIKEEMKESEGDPHIKMRMRRMARDLLRRKMMSAVDTATAVVMNPTHYAVAIRYVPAEMPAPKVVAKGKNFLALRIRERATKHQVPVIENPPLARALYKSAEVGQEIPAHLYRAVAEILAYLYRLGTGRFGGTR